MAEKDGANIPEGTHESIAVYLASFGAGKDGKAGGEESGFPRDGHRHDLAHLSL